MPAISVTVKPLELPLVHPFKIARGEETVSRTALVKVRAGDFEGIGFCYAGSSGGALVAHAVERFTSVDEIHIRVGGLAAHDGGRVVADGQPGLGAVAQL